MKAIYWQKGDTLDYVPAEDVENGAAVSLGTRIGIAAAPIRGGEQGAVHVEGVFRLVKAKGEALDMGAAVFYDAGADAVTASAEGNIPAGYAAAPAAAGDAAVLVKLLG